MTDIEAQKKYDTMYELALELGEADYFVILEIPLRVNDRSVRRTVQCGHQVEVYFRLHALYAMVCQEMFLPSRIICWIGARIGFARADKINTTE